MQIFYRINRYLSIFRAPINISCFTCFSDFDFLNDLLKGERYIRDIRFLDKELLPEFEGDRGTIYDIYCTTESGEYFIVEMQNARLNIELPDYTRVAFRVDPIINPHAVTHAFSFCISGGER